MIKLLCKWFNLIKREKMKQILRDMLFKMAYTQTKLKAKYKNKEISEWSYYRKLWTLRGRLQMLEELIDTLK